MKLNFHKVKQRSKEWFNLRVQYPLTASKAQAIASQGKGLETLCNEKIAEKYAVIPFESYESPAMKEGKEKEAHAVFVYEVENMCRVEEVGFVTNESISKVGGVSPDGLVGDDGLIEVKVFKPMKYWDYLINDKDPEKKYLWQMQMQLLFTERKWVDFVLYSPYFEKNLIVKRIYPDKKMQSAIKKGLQKGENMLKLLEDKYKNNYGRLEKRV